MRSSVEIARVLNSVADDFKRNGGKDDIETSFVLRDAAHRCEILNTMARSLVDDIMWDDGPHNEEAYRQRDLARLIIGR